MKPAVMVDEATIEQQILASSISSLKSLGLSDDDELDYVDDNPGNPWEDAW